MYMPVDRPSTTPPVSACEEHRPEASCAKAAGAPVVEAALPGAATGHPDACTPLGKAIGASPTGSSSPAAAAYFGFFAPDEGVPPVMTFLMGKPLNAALDEIEAYASEEEQAQGLLQDARFVQCGRGKKLAKKLASSASPARARLLDLQQKWDADKEAKKKVAAHKKAWLATSTATR
jgi:hypothetical protein